MSAERVETTTVNRNPELFLSLPAKTQTDLRARSDYATIIPGTRDRRSFSLKMSAAETQETISELKSKRNQLFEPNESESWRKRSWTGSSPYKIGYIRRREKVHFTQTNIGRCSIVFVT